MLRAAIYSYSWFPGDEQHDSFIAEQIRVCGEWARREKLKIVGFYEDQETRGRTVANRPGLRQIQEASVAREFDVFLVAELSSLSRGTAGMGEVIDRLIARGIRVVGVRDGYDSNRLVRISQSGNT